MQAEYGVHSPSCGRSLQDLRHDVELRTGLVLLGRRARLAAMLASAGRAAAEVMPSRKVRTSQGKVVGNADPGKPAGKCHRNDTA